MKAMKNTREVILPCGCHKVGSDGSIHSRLVRVSRLGHQGFAISSNESWHRISGSLARRSGYIQVNLHGKIIRLNRLIATAFVPNPMNLPECQHRNGVRGDNRSDNLKWGTPRENASDREQHGRTSRGSNRPNAKLEEVQIVAIRAARGNGATLQSIASTFSVSKKLIQLIVTKKIWKHVV